MLMLVLTQTTATTHCNNRSATNNKWLQSLAVVAATTKQRMTAPTNANASANPNHCNYSLQQQISNQQQVAAVTTWQYCNNQTDNHCTN